MALARAERSVQVAGLRPVLRQRRPDETQRLVEGHPQLRGDHVGVQGGLDVLHALGEAQHEVTLVDLLRDADELAQQRLPGLHRCGRHRRVPPRRPRRCDSSAPRMAGVGRLFPDNGIERHRGNCSATSTARPGDTRPRERQRTTAPPHRGGARQVLWGTPPPGTAGGGGTFGHAERATVPSDVRPHAYRDELIRCASNSHHTSSLSASATYRSMSSSHTPRLPRSGAEARMEWIRFESSKLRAISG